MRLKLICEGVLVSLVNHYTTQGAKQQSKHSDLKGVKGFPFIPFHTISCKCSFTLSNVIDKNKKEKLNSSFLGLMTVTQKHVFHYLPPSNQAYTWVSVKLRQILSRQILLPVLNQDPYVFLV